MHAVDLLSRRAKLTPEREALLDTGNGRRYTYAALNERASRAANFLRDKLGVQKGDRVSLLAHNSVVTVDLLYGLMKIGAVFAPLNWRLVAPELVYIVNNCESRVLLVGPEFVELFAEMQPDLCCQHFVAIEGAQIDGALVYEDELAQASEDEPQRPLLHPDDTACILYTSGTTGRPKGAMIPQRMVLWNAINTVVSWGLTPDDVSPILTPMFHSGGLFVFLTPLFYVGGRVVIARTFALEDSLKLIQEENCTVLLGVPTIFQMWLDLPGFRGADFGSVRWFISGGASCPPALIEAWRAATGKPFRQGYGLTEVGPNCFTMTDADAVRKVGSVGKPIFHSQMRLVDENGRDVPLGKTGELLISGPHVTTGYWRNAAATAETLCDGWFHTGDMARRDAEGFYTIVGRFKDMIISGGENVYAAEVEAVFLTHTAVAECALIGKPDAKWGEVGLVIVVPEKGQKPAEDDLIDHCRQRLARYKVPKEIIFTDALPYSPYGKVMKAELREKYL